MRISISASSSYQYGLRQTVADELRKQPHFVEYIKRENVKNSFFFESEYPYGMVVFSLPLHHDVIERFNLVDLNSPEENRIWNAFVTFVRNLRKVNPRYSLDDFYKDYILSNGTRVNENPLYNGIKPHSALYTRYLKKYTSYTPNYAGMKQFWESCGSK